ncbi:DUF4189 domain-containing protein [Roseibium sp. Sym1]|uniref:DUF4189 domain-containing protein n=1 Tax=Roseibium sp. Sym1 TaxID=3016006 RepID=UPI0022B4468E|nr:DUF4189 domain-containing protein [Roseibium sp. Sym1]
MKSIAFAGLLTAAILFAGSAANASESLSYRCNLGNQFVFVQTIPEEGRAVLEDINGNTSLVPDGRGGYFNDAEEISFEPDTKSRLWLGDVSHPCQLATADVGIKSSGGGAHLNAQGQSLGGKLRAGPGMSFPQTGSLSEGTWITILANSGVRMDGYDWFEVATDTGQRGFQWGGIMCSNGQQLAGTFQACRAQAAAPRSGTQVAQGRGWMAFALAPGGAFGHGAAPTKGGAEQYAMQYCGNAQCRIADTTQARCHALAVSPNSNGIGAGDSEQAAINFAMGRCSNNGARGCTVKYSYCQ